MCHFNQRGDTKLNMVLNYVIASLLATQEVAQQDE